MNFFLSWLLATYITCLFCLISSVQGMFDPAGISSTLLADAIEVWLVLFTLLFFLLTELESQLKRLNKPPSGRRRFD